MKKVKFVIIGGGITGLSTAFYLKEKINLLGRNDSITLLEQDSTLGGHIESVKKEGFIFEGGPRGFLAEGRRTLSLCKELGIWDELQISSDASRIRFVWKDGVLNPLPKSPFDLFKSKIIGFQEIKTIIKEYFKRNQPSFPDESVAEFFIRRFSEDMLQNIFELLVTGVYAGNPRRLSAKSIYPKLKQYEAEYGSIIKGFLKAKKENEKGLYPKEITDIGKRKLVSFKGGMITIVEALEQNLGDIAQTGVKINNIEYGTESPSKISITKNDGSTEEIEAEHIIVTTPAYFSAELLKPLSEQLYKLLNDIEYSPIQVVCLGYKNKVHDYNGFGFLSPRREKLKMLGCILNELVFPTLAPQGGMNLTAIYGGACHPETSKWTEEYLVNETKRELNKTMGIKAEPDLVETFIYEKGIAQYNIGHSNRIETIFEILQKFPSVSLLGSYINGVGVNDCIKNAYQFVQELDIQSME